MAKKIKFPLKMSDGAQVRTLEELREHFDIASVLSYYADGRLVEWLTDRHYEDKAEKATALDSSANDFKQSLCEILEVTYSEEDVASVDLSDISAKNKRREELKKHTSDDKILAAIDRVAFAQEELDRLLDEGKTEIYLCGESFKVPGSKEGVTYIGVGDNKPTVDVPKGFAEKKIKFENVEIDIDRLIESVSGDFEALPIDVLIKIAETGNAEAQFEVVKKMAEQGDAEAQYKLGKRYEEYDDSEKAVAWYHKAAEQGHAEAQFKLGGFYFYGEDVERNDEESIKWHRKAAEQGHSGAQYYLGECYRLGCGVEKNFDEAIKWFQKAAEQGYAEAQMKLGYSYRDGCGVDENKEEAVKWFQKAAEQGYLSVKDIEEILLG